MMKPLFNIFLFFSIFPLSYGFAQTDSIRKQDAAIAERFFQSVAPATVDSLLVKAALFFQNTPYVPGTLDINDREELVVNLRETDCMIFVENCLALARTRQNPSPDLDYLERELRKIRYRNGIINGYTSRLHYTGDWIFDNIKKGMIEDMTFALGGRRFKPNVYYMSENPQKYKQLAGNPEDRQHIRTIEQEMNARGNYYYIPRQEISKHLSLIKNGDIICFTTSIPGLDISHLGIAYWHKRQLTFIHASSSAKKVIINTESLADYCQMIRTITGIMVLRPVSGK